MIRPAAESTFVRALDVLLESHLEIQPVVDGFFRQAFNLGPRCAGKHQQYISNSVVRAALAIVTASR